VGSRSQESERTNHQGTKNAKGGIAMAIDRRPTLTSCPLNAHCPLLSTCTCVYITTSILRTAERQKQLAKFKNVKISLRLELPRLRQRFACFSHREFGARVRGGCLDSAVLRCPGPVDDRAGNASRKGAKGAKQERLLARGAPLLACPATSGWVESASPQLVALSWGRRGRPQPPDACSGPLLPEGEGLGMRERPSVSNSELPATCRRCFIGNETGRLMAKSTFAMRGIDGIVRRESTAGQASSATRRHAGGDQRGQVH
jgi:hypothetical protein